MDVGEKALRVAFGSVPKDGGTFTCYRNLRPRLLEQGIDMRCVSVGREQALLVEADYVDEGCELLAPRTLSAKKQAQAFAAWCDQESIDIVIGVNSGAILSSVPHLPESIRLVARCANAFDHGYKITMVGRERLAAIIAITPRLQRDLAGGYGAEPSLMHLIPNGVDLERFHDRSMSSYTDTNVLELGFLGRLEHKQKGVLHIPPILDELDGQGVEYRLRIAGKGKHGPELQRRLAGHVASGKVEFLGALPPDGAAAFLNSTQVLLFPSHFEGCPNVLLEAVAAGCVPVCWEMEGINDYVVRAGETGFICKLGDYSSVAGYVSELAGSRTLLAQLGAAAARDARERFDIERVAGAYAELFRSVMTAPAPKWETLAWSRFEPDANFDWSWRRYIPDSIKAPIRTLMGKA